MQAAPVTDPHHVERLYERHAAAILAYAHRRCDRQRAEDVLAETFLVAWRRRHEVPADALPWLYAVAANVLHNQRRSDRRQAAVAERIAGEAEPLPQDATDQGLLRALALLRPIDREALLLTAWEGLDPARAALAAGCSRATFHVRLHRARRRLAQLLERTGPRALPKRPNPERTP